MQHSGYGAKSEEQMDARLTMYRARIWDYDVIRPPADGNTAKFFVAPKAPSVGHEKFSFANFETLSGDVQRGGCGGDSGGPIMDIDGLNSGRATIVGTFVGGSSCTALRDQYKRRKAFPLSPIDKNVDPMVTRIRCLYATRVGSYVDWINLVIKEKSGNQNPNDAFIGQTKHGSHLASAPDWKSLGLEVVTQEPPSLSVDEYFPV